MANIFTQQVLNAFSNQVPELEEYVNSVQPVLKPSMADPFDRLIRSIIYQQLSGKAAATIYQRFEELLGTITPGNILNTSDEDLRSAGLSRQKAGYVKNVAHKFQQGGELAQYQSSSDLADLSDDEIIDLFTSIKGVGEWTVQMYLIFGLGRMNVFAAKDLGVRKGLQLMYEMEELPKPAQAKNMTSHWDGYKSVGTVLCWRVQDE